MGGLRLQIRRQVDDVDRFKGAFLDTDTTTDAEVLGEERDLVLRRHLDAEFACPDKTRPRHEFLDPKVQGVSKGGQNRLTHTNDGAGLFALLATFLWLALVRRDDGDTRQTLVFVVFLSHDCLGAE